MSCFTYLLFTKKVSILLSVISCAGHTIILTSNMAEYTIIDTLMISLTDEEIPLRYPFRSWLHQHSLYHTTDSFEQAINIVQSIFYTRIARRALTLSAIMQLTSPLLTMEARLLSANDLMMGQLKKWLGINNATKRDSANLRDVTLTGNKKAKSQQEAEYLDKVSDDQSSLWEECQVANNKNKTPKEYLISARKSVRKKRANSRESKCAELKKKQPLQGDSKDSVQPCLGYPEDLKETLGLKQTVFLDEDREAHAKLLELAKDASEKTK